jgi:heme exporter protein B
VNGPLALFRRDLRLAHRHGGGLVALLFFAVVIAIVPFGVGPDLGLLRRIGPAILWVGALLATLLTLDRVLVADHEDGSLDLIRLSGASLEVALAAKACAHWLTTTLPLALAAPFLGLLLGMDIASGAAIGGTLLVGTPALTFLGLIGAALSISLRRGALLLPVLVVPLCIPVLIFGVASANSALQGEPFGPALTILCGLSLGALVLGPFGAAAALHYGLED